MFYNTLCLVCLWICPKMLQLAQLQVHHFRCMAHMDAHFGPRTNLIDGLNGSGKTSILEAIYYLSMGRSFRSRQHRFVVQREQQACYLHAQLQQDGFVHRIGIERTVQGKGQYKLNGTLLASITPLAQQIPVCLLHPERLRHLASGPKPRRQLLDWGLFYQRPDFLPLWRRYSQARSQRNAALKQGIFGADMHVWSQMLCDMAPQIDAMRVAYLDQLGALLQPLCERLFKQPLDLSWSYVRGWPQDMTLSEVLTQHLPRDMALGYTQHGPHRADFVLKSYQQPVHQVLSQGQQKLLAYALLLAQMQLLGQTKPGLLLIDDLPAELDQRSIAVISEVVQEMPIQSFVTAIAAESLPTLLNSQDCQRFHVKHGVVTSHDAALAG
jgi:DNA replication and repair protein RecF